VYHFRRWFVNSTAVSAALPSVEGAVEAARGWRVLSNHAMINKRSRKGGAERKRNMVCPNCKNPIGDSSDFCIFCGKAFTRRGKTAARYCADEPKRRRPARRRAQRFLNGIALAAALAVFCAVWFSPAGRFTGTPASAQADAAPVPAATNTPAPELTSSPEPAATPAATQTPVVTPEPAATPAPSATPEPTATPTPEPAAEDGPFAGVSGSYPVALYIFDASSDDPEVQPELDELPDYALEGTMTLEVDDDGNGFIRIDQELLDPAEVPVSPFVDDYGNVSGDTLVGIVQQSDYQLAVSCICMDGSVSGFIWMDDEQTHIVIMFFGQDEAFDAFEQSGNGFILRRYFPEERICPLAFSADRRII